MLITRFDQGGKCSPIPTRRSTVEGGESMTRKNSEAALVEAASSTPIPAITEEKE